MRTSSSNACTCSGFEDFNDLLPLVAPGKASGEKDVEEVIEEVFAEEPVAAGV
jgi:hypothetical protein